MGDRANVVVRQYGERPPVVLYSHWGGTELAETVQEALKKRWRWDDHAYLTRIVFEQMIGSQRDTETGFGISTDFPDNEHKVIVLDPNEERIGFTPRGMFNIEQLPEPRHWWSFKEFIELDPDEVRRRYLEDG